MRAIKNSKLIVYMCAYLHSCSHCGPSEHIDSCLHQDRLGKAVCPCLWRHVAHRYRECVNGCSSISVYSCTHACIHVYVYPDIIWLVPCHTQCHPHTRDPCQKVPATAKVASQKTLYISSDHQPKPHLEQSTLNTLPCRLALPLNVPAVPTHSPPRAGGGGGAHSSRIKCSRADTQPS
ncbi:hypothetical protein BCR44DRAFT_1294370 [Catenaria anguillulae PL171]|uniref:Uncharacterized protein n=1 Tax=Catenaria anguillulae PL171 TaxID=765915 RepID=A0A1Y2HV62_9FUNG|nr:hypothetical protein BCR44DRAFT_1294370 [Catenaria anguillulae PL171]